ncbi:MAG: hypothetical protein WAN46_15015 [Gammaproteobacteria bacterium]|jgi:hypothetical protein
MDYLDDLRKQAQVLRGEQVGPSPEERQQAAVERVLQLSLRLIYGYLRELAAQLNVVKPHLSVSYDIEGYGQIADLSQGDYILGIDAPTVIGDLSLAFACGSRDPRPRVIRTSHRSAFLKQRDYLWRHGLKFDSKLAVGGEGTFLLEPMVPVSLRFLPDPKVRRIRFVIKNLDLLGEESYLIDPLRLKRQHLDGIAGLVLRKPNSLEKLTGTLITDDAKVRIRQALAEERRQQLCHEAEAAAISLAEQKAKAEGRLAVRMCRAIGRLTAAVNSLCRRLHPYALSACQRGLDELKCVASKISTRVHTYLFR